MPEAGGGAILEPGEGTTVQNPVGGPLTYKVTGDDSGGGMTVFESLVPPDEGPPLHTHAGQEEFLYVVEGEMRFKIGDEIRPAPPGSLMFVPRGVPHAFHNAGTEPAKLLVGFSPAGMEPFFAAFAELEDGANHQEAFAALGREVGMEVVGPPLAISDPV